MSFFVVKNLGKIFSFEVQDIIFTCALLESGGFIFDLPSRVYSPLALYLYVGWSVYLLLCVPSQAVCAVPVPLGAL